MSQVCCFFSISGQGCGVHHQCESTGSVIVFLYGEIFYYWNTLPVSFNTILVSLVVVVYSTVPSIHQQTPHIPANTLLFYIFCWCIRKENVLFHCSPGTTYTDRSYCNVMEFEILSDTLFFSPLLLGLQCFYDI